MGGGPSFLASLGMVEIGLGAVASGGFGGYSVGFGAELSPYLVFDRGKLLKAVVTDFVIDTDFVNTG